MSVLAPTGVAVITCDAVLVILGVVSVLLRTVAIRVRGRNIKAHDYLVFLGLCLSIAAVINQINGVYNGGIGTHFSDLPSSEQMAKTITTLKAIVTADILWILATWAIKLSILLMYHEVFDKHAFQLACTSTIGIISLTMFTFLLTQFFVCLPFSENWNPTKEGCHLKNFDFANATAAVNMVFDLTIAVLPIPILAKLQVPTARKVGLALLLSLGLGICAINIARLALFHKLDKLDLTYTIAVPSILSSLELYLGIVVACAPFIRSLFKPPAAAPNVSGSESSSTASAKRQQSKQSEQSGRSATLVSVEIENGLELGEKLKARGAGNV